MFIQLYFSKKKRIHVSYWIENIVNNKKNKIKITKKKVYLFRIKVSFLGLKKYIL